MSYVGERLWWPMTMVAYTKPRQRKKAERKRVREESYDFDMLLFTAFTNGKNFGYVFPVIQRGFEVNVSLQEKFIVDGSTMQKMYHPES